MTVVANRWTRRTRQYDAMIHALDCGSARRRSQPDKWREFASIGEALAHYGLAYVCTKCLPGQGPHRP